MITTTATFARARALWLPFLLLTTAAACVDSGSRTSSADSTSASRLSPVVSSVRVNQGTYGMASRVKWMLSPDRLSMLAMVDPVGVENEAVPNGFFYGSENRNFQARMDNVWDVAPSPDWETIAFSRAYVLNPRESDTIPPSMWQEIARLTGMDTATVRNGSFASSGMSMARAIAQPGIIRVPADPRASGASDAAAPRMFPIPTGWRMRWTQDGSIIALGNSPAMVQDDEDSQSWAALDPKTGAFHGSLPEGAKLIAPRWVSGPVLDISVPVDMATSTPIEITTGSRTFSLETIRGVITAREKTAVADSAVASITIGSGKALAATRGGRYILALAPRATAVAHEIPVEAIVYVVGW